MNSGYQRLLVPVNGTAGDRQALRLVGDMAARRTVDVTLIYVVEVQQAMPLDAELPDEIDRGEAALAAAEEFAATVLDLKHDVLNTDLLQARLAGAAIVDEAIERHADAIVLATQNRTRLGKVSIGDAATYILRNAPCDVIVVRQSAGRHRES